MNWEKYSKQRRKDKLIPLAKILDKMNLDITAGTTVDDHDLYNAPMLVRKPNTLKRFHKYIVLAAAKMFFFYKILVPIY